MATTPIEGSPAREAAHVRRLRLGAAWASLGAALVHTAVSGAHAAEWWGYGAFFVTAAGAQAVFGILLLGEPWRHDEDGTYDPARNQDLVRVLYRTAVVVNVLMIALYVVTRTIGIPVFGPEAGEREAVDFAGVLAVVLEAGLSACLVGLLAAEPPRTARS